MDLPLFMIPCLRFVGVRKNIATPMLHGLTVVLRFLNMLINVLNGVDPVWIIIIPCPI